MSKDIRSFFMNSKNNFKSCNWTDNKSCKKTTFIISDDEIHTNSITTEKIEIKQKKFKDNEPKKRSLISSDEDEVECTSNIKKKKAKFKEEESSDHIEKLIEVVDKSEQLLNINPVKRVNSKKINEKISKETINNSKINHNIDFINGNDDFEDTLNQLDTSKIEDEYLSMINNQETSFFKSKEKDFTNKQQNDNEIKIKDKFNFTKKKKNELHYEDKAEILTENNSITKNNMEKDTFYVEHTNLIKNEMKKDNKLFDKNNSIDLDQNLILQTNIDKKKYNAILYHNYLNRGGPKNPGSKEIPKGNDQCFVNLNFLITGVLDSLENNEVEKIIKQYGGKVVHSVTKNLNYIIVGDEPGPAKLAKAENIGIQKITEDGFLDLIRTRSTAMEIKNHLIDHTNTNKSNGKYSSMCNNIKICKHYENNIDSLQKECMNNVKEKNFNCNKNIKSRISCIEAKSNIILNTRHEIKKDMEEITSIINNSTRPENSSVIPNLNSMNNLKNIDPKLNDITALVEKYRPKDVKQIIGQSGEKSNAKKLEYWLANWNKNHEKNYKIPKSKFSFHDDNGTIYKAALLSGPPGIGKTTTAYVVCAKLGYEILEFNASDTRNKKLLQEEISGILFNKTIKLFLTSTIDTKKILPKHVLLMDEVDGMAGNEDRGGLQELIAFIKCTEIPIICICNDRNSQKIKTLANYTFDLRFQKPRIEQIKAAMMSICFKERIRVSPEELTLIIQSTNQDVRQIINHIAMLSAKSQIIIEKKEKIQYKNLKLGPWDVVRKIFSSEEHKKMNIHDKSDLFFHDYNIAPLFVEENYPIVTPIGLKHKLFEKLANCSESLAIGDIIENTIRTNQVWSLLPVQACFSSVLPGSEMSGSLNSQINFPSWLGQNSKRIKYNRLLQDITANTRIATGANKEAINLDYLKMLLNSIIRPLIIEGTKGIEKSLHVMSIYNISKQDLDSLTELTKWPYTRDPMQFVDTKTKTAFTKAYNKSALINTANSIKNKHMHDNQIEYFIKNNEEESSDDCDSKVENDKLIKMKILNTKHVSSRSKGKIKNIFKINKICSKKK